MAEPANSSMPAPSVPTTVLTSLSLANASWSSFLIGTVILATMWMGVTKIRTMHIDAFARSRYQCQSTVGDVRHLPSAVEMTNYDETSPQVRKTRAIPDRRDFVLSRTHAPLTQSDAAFWRDFQVRFRIYARLAQELEDYDRSNPSSPWSAGLAAWLRRTSNGNTVALQEHGHDSFTTATEQTQPSPTARFQGQKVFAALHFLYLSITPSYIGARCLRVAAYYYRIVWYPHHRKAIIDGWNDNFDRLGTEATEWLNVFEALWLP